MNLDQFWQNIETAWQADPELFAKRKEALQTDDTNLFEELSGDIEETLVEHYENVLYELDETELVSFIHHFEERLYNIDREDIHKYVDGSDDGFLYARCFIVAMGREYYDRVDEAPGAAHPDLEAEGFGFTMYPVYADRFDEEFERNSKHCIESCSNPKGWPNQ